jgi:hypothetical protein
MIFFRVTPDMTAYAMYIMKISHKNHASQHYFQSSAELNAPEQMRDDDGDGGGPGR